MKNTPIAVCLLSLSDIITLVLDLQYFWMLLLRTSACDFVSSCVSFFWLFFHYHRRLVSTSAQPVDATWLCTPPRYLLGIFGRRSYFVELFTGSSPWYDTRVLTVFGEYTELFLNTVGAAVEMLGDSALYKFTIEIDTDIQSTIDNSITWHHSIVYFPNSAIYVIETNFP